MDALIYMGFAVNIAGAIYGTVMGIKYYPILKKSKNMPIQQSYDVSAWRSKRRVFYGLMIGGLLIALLGCTL